MSNLLPPAARKQVVIEYWLRTISVWFFLLTFGLVVVAVLAFPSVSILFVQSSNMSQQVDQAASGLEEIKVAEAEIETVNKQVREINAMKASVPFTEYAKQLGVIAGDSVTISMYKFQETKTSQDITISGQAATRLALTGFVEAVEADDLFQSAELPIANLAQDTDINFQITVTPAPVTESE